MNLVCPRLAPGLDVGGSCSLLGVNLHVVWWDKGKPIHVSQLALGASLPSLYFQFEMQQLLFSSAHLLILLASRITVLGWLLRSDARGAEPSDRRQSKGT